MCIKNSELFLRLILFDSLLRLNSILTFNIYIILRKSNRQQQQKRFLDYYC